MSTYGDGDPSIPPRVQQAHDEACAAGRPLYRDPISGGQVLTALRLRQLDVCCGNGCRHCPWPAEVQRAAGRDRARPA